MKKFLPLWLLLVIVICVNIFFRMSVAFLSFTEGAARDSVMADLTKDAQKQIDERFKDLPPQAKFRARQQLVNIWKQERKKAINDAIRNKQKDLKSNWQDESGHTFLLEIDPYHWFRLVHNLVTNGKIGDKVIDSAQYDSFMLAPLGMKIEPSLHKNLHVYLTYYLFRAAKIFKKNISLIHFVFYMPIFISSLMLASVFLMCLTLSRNRVNVAGFFAAMSLGLAPIFLLRSFGGWFDTDPYVILFSVLSAWTFYLSLNYDISLRRRFLFATLSGLSIGLFSFTWDGWWYIFDFMIVSTLMYTLNLYLIKKDSEEEVRLNIPLISLALFVLSSVVFVGIFSGLAVLKHIFSGPINIVFAKGYLQSQFWPNTFLTVQELKGTSLLEVINSAGGGIVLILGLLYLIITLSDKKSKDYKYRQFIIFYFALWIIVMLYVSTKASRFSLLLILPSSISFGLFLEWAIDSLNNIIARLIKIRKINIKGILFVILCLVFLPIFFSRAFALRRAVPLMDKSWWNVLNKIKTQTPKDSIINSWWDFGHWFKAIAERRVIFDGATQNTPMAYWMGRVFLTDNEAEAIGILRMLNSGSNKAFEELEKLGIDKYKCLDILNEIIMLSNKDANTALAKFVSKQEDREKILSYTHHPQAAYFIVEPSLIYKIHPISFLGNWDFKKADIYQKFRQFKKEGFIEYLIKEYKYNKADALRLYDSLVFINTKDALTWISSAYRFFNESRFFRKEGNLLLFDNDFIVDLSNHNVYFSDIRDGNWKVPKSLFYLEGDVLKEIDFKTNDLDFSVLLVEEKDNYKIVVLDSKLAKSMLTRLYYLRGLKLQYFKPFISEELKDNAGRIIVYKIDWDKGE